MAELCYTIFMYDNMWMLWLAAIFGLIVLSCQES